MAESPSLLRQETGGSRRPEFSAAETRRPLRSLGTPCSHSGPRDGCLSQVVRAPDALSFQPHVLPLTEKPPAVLPPEEDLSRSSSRRVPGTGRPMPGPGPAAAISATPQRPVRPRSPTGNPAEWLDIQVTLEGPWCRACGWTGGTVRFGAVAGGDTGLPLSEPSQPWP